LHDEFKIAEMKKTILLISLQLFNNLLLAQVDTTQTDTTKSVYKNLETREFYDVGLEEETEDDTTVYKVNEKVVNKKTYDKYSDVWSNIDTCKPCILKTYDENDKLIYKGIQYTDCRVGFWIEYYADGKAKVIGHFRENETGNWDSAYYKGYCRKDGTWTYYNENGKKLYSEYWKDGDFIKQVPEQKKTEIWKVELTLNGEQIDEQMLLANQVRDLVITPKFKNASTDSVNLTIEFQISAIGRKYLKPAFTIDSFKMFDLNKLLLENRFRSDDKISYSLMVFNNKEYIAYFNLNILADLPKSTDSLINSTDSTEMITTNYDFYLVNSADTTKKIKLMNKIEYDLSYDATPHDTVTEQKTITLQGHIVNLNEKLLTCSVFTEIIYLTLKNGFVSRTDNDYTNFVYPGNEYLRNISLINLYQIDYTSPSRYFFWTFGSATTVLSVVATAIVAPLVSINYKDGGFNKDRYFAVAGSGLIGLSIGIPLTVAGKQRAYKLTDRNFSEGKGKGLWYLESQIKQ